jgi:8-oxo-dGTP pyrophosphatase MutT (NUDIX family)
MDWRGLADDAMRLWWLGGLVLAVVVFVSRSRIAKLARQLGAQFIYRRRAAVAVVHRGREVLMVKRRSNPEGLTWQFPAGSMHRGDGPGVTAIREVQQETGVNASFECILGERLHPDTGVYLYYCVLRYESGETKNGDSRENAEVEWVPAEAVQNRVTTNLDDNVRRFLMNL